MINIYILFCFVNKEKEYIQLEIPKKDMTLNRLEATIKQAKNLLIEDYYSNLKNDKIVKVEYFFNNHNKDIKIFKSLNINSLFKLHFFINKSGKWDSNNCYECCTDCSNCCEEICPLDFENTCNNCVFKNGYKKNLVFRL